MEEPVILLSPGISTVAPSRAGVGVGNLAGMAALTGVMVIEKTVPGGKRLSPFIGVILLLFAVLWLLHPVWLQRAGI